MYTFLIVTQVTTMIFVAIMIIFVMRSKPSQVQSTAMGFFTTVFFFLMGYLLELLSDNVNAYYVALKLEYFSLALMMLAILRFVSGFCKFKISTRMYMTQVIISIMTVIVIFTVEYNPILYKSVEAGYNGHFTYCKVVPGPYYYINYLDFSLIYIYVIVYCVKGYFKCNAIDKKRNGIVIIGLIIPTIAGIAKPLGLSFGYDVFTFGIFGAAICFAFAVIRYGYLNSVQAAIDNAINYGSASFIVISYEKEILFANNHAKMIIPEVTSAENINEIKILHDIYTNNEVEVVINASTYDVRIEPIVEYDCTQGYIIWIIDMTEYHNHVKKLEEMTKRAEAANQAKSSFLANVSHEIRTPMNAILGMDEIILRKTNDDDIISCAVNIESAGNTLLSIINDILDISKIESGKVEIISVKYELSSVLNDVINMTKEKAYSKGLTYDITVAPDIPYALKGDELRIRQIMLNIVNNAVKYTPTGGVSIRVAHVQGKNPNEIILIIAVSDTGIGIKEENIKSLYKSFTRIDEKANRKIEGTGLGLSITKHLIDLMNGSIEVESIYQKGSTFTVKIPQIIEIDKPIGDFKLISEIDKVKAKKNKKIFKAPNAKILVVDDNSMNLEVVKGLLLESEIQVATAMSGKECIVALSRNTYNIVFLDQMMPELDGIETLKIINEKGLAKDTPIIAFTANAVIGSKEMFLENGFCDYISKPINYDSFEKKIISYLPAELVCFEDNKEFSKEALDKINIPVLDGIDVTAGLSYFKGNIKNYNNILSVFYKSIPEMLIKLNDYLIDEDIKSYAIIVHSLKSTAKNIGADRLSEIAKTHELKAVQEDYNYLLSHFINLKKEIERIMHSISYYLNDAHQNKEENTMIRESPVVEKNITILIVDDDILSLQYAKSVLGDKYNVVCMKSGERALAYLQRCKPDLIVSDVNMPEMSGIEFLGLLREDEKNKSIPVIFITGQSNIDYKAYGVEYIEKPFRVESLEEKLESLLAKG